MVTTSETINASLAAGTYYTKVSPKGNVSNTISCYTLKITTGTAGKSFLIALNTGTISTELSPNPAKQVLHISMKGYAMEKIIEVFDLNGRRLISEKVMQDDKAIQVGALPAGLYIVRVITSYGTVLSRSKFVKE